VTLDSRDERVQRVVRGVAAAVLVVGAAVALALRVVVDDELARVTRPVQPKLFHGSVGATALEPRAVFGVAHNAGDSLHAVTEAVAAGAQVVEIDVVAVRGELRVAHDRPLPALGLDAPDLESIWGLASAAGAVELDLKQTSPLFLEALLPFLAAHRGVDVIVASRRVAVLRAVRERAPWARRFLSVGNRVALERALRDPFIDGIVQGVSIRHDLLDARTVRRLKQQDVVVLAWVVNDVPRLNRLLRYGVDGVTTDNLAILELLAVRARAKPGLQAEGR
jgi:glycerophosphoryl diester phosphodiesterase